MNKSQLITGLARRLPGLRNQDAEIIINTIFAKMTQSLADGERIEIRGFGSFQLRTRRAHMGRDPKTGAGVRVAEKKVPFFKAGKNLRERVDTLNQNPATKRGVKRKPGHE